MSKNQSYYVEDFNQGNFRVYTSFTEVARRILGEFMNFRRVQKESRPCDGLDCQICSSFHLPKIISSVKKNAPVTFVLPAFPGKSPNTKKVLGVLPDYAEHIALKFLNELCNKVKDYYLPGAKIIICSDGRVFSDIIGIKESDISAYQIELTKIIEENALTNISTFNLDDYYTNLSFEEMRTELMDRYGSSIDCLKQKIRTGEDISASAEEREANRMYKGMTRFLFEDSLYPGQIKSNSAIQKDARVKAYEVIRRSNAWSKLIADYFPSAIRLSIHPQTCGATKLGIRLIADESWITPWHGVAVKTSNGFQLLKRSEAENLGAVLIYSYKNQPSYYILEDNSKEAFVQERGRI